MSTQAQAVTWPTPITSLTETIAPADDDFLLLDGMVNGTRRYSSRPWRDQLVDTAVVIADHEARIAALEAVGGTLLAERVAALESQLIAAVERLATAEATLQRIKDL